VSGDAKVEGGSYKLDLEYGKIVWVDHWPEGLLRHKGDDDDVANDATGVQANNLLYAVKKSAAQIAMV
jgi:hypothetical protein